MKKLLYIFPLIILWACANPFAPELVDEENRQNVLFDQTTVDGLFQNWSIAYNFRDTIVYSLLLDDEFMFTFRDFELGVDKSWSRETDMLTTHKLFQTSEYIELFWNDYLFTSGDSLLWDATRNFNLKITFSADDIVNITGRARVRLRRPTGDDNWKIYAWIDESNY